MNGLIEKNKKLSVRFGCNLCKKDPPTEQFDGYRGNILWFCSPCIKKLKQIAEKKAK